MKFKKENLYEGLDDRTTKALKDYHKYACLEEDAPIGEIDEWALTAACVDNAYEKCDLRKALQEKFLREETVEDAARKIDAEVEVVNDKTQLEELLDEKLEIAERKHRMAMKRGEQAYDFPNVMLISDPGFGKTEITKKWAKENNINLFILSLSTAGPETFGGIVARDPDDPRYATVLGTRALDALDRERSVLFLDEYNRAKTDIRGLVLTLVQDHKLPDPVSKEEGGDGLRYFPNYLFTIAAMNYDDGSDIGAKQLGGAEKNRFDRYEISPSPLELLRHLKSAYARNIEDAANDKEKAKLVGQLALAEAILGNKKFRFNTHQEFVEGQDDPRFNQTSYRSFTTLLEATDGTKENLLKKWSRFCDYNQKATIEAILTNYVDVKDKANQAIAGGTESEVFKQEKSDLDKLADAFPGLFD